MPKLTRRQVHVAVGDRHALVSGEVLDRGRGFGTDKSSCALAVISLWSGCMCENLVICVLPGAYIGARIAGRKGGRQ